MFELFVENPLYFMAILVCIGIFVNSYISYITSSYYKVTKHFYFDIYTDKGKYGEYLIYKHLKKMEADGAKFLFNLYIPNSSGGTTEIDVLIISPKGIFVFESKNYSGWIFGSENQKNWYQTLSGRDRTCCKEKFYNPVRQNRAHIEALKKFLQVNVPMWSIIVFSERCTLKSIEITSNDVAVINRDKLGREVASIYN
ncbi:MAG: NERD domain-containing protein [Clostridia bacterium]|nr:NERD domain-containing protein [Clostridia bacterium]